MIRAIGERQARRYFLSAEIISSEQALSFGLVHEIVEDQNQLDQAADRFIKQLSLNSPQAMAAAKQLIFAVSQKQIEDSVIDYTSHCIADIRASDEGQEGLDAFLNKRQANWIFPIEGTTTATNKEKHDV